MVGFNYVVVEVGIAERLRNLAVGRVGFRPAKIWDRANDIEYSNYEQVIINHHFESAQINDIDLDGKQLLLMDSRYLFVTPELKSELEASKCRFNFSKGLTRFG